MKQLTIEAEQWCLEKIAQYNDSLKGWEEPDGLLIPTEPDPEERDRTRTRLRAAWVVLADLLIRFCGRTEKELLQLRFVNGVLYGYSSIPSTLKLGRNVKTGEVNYEQN